MISNEEISRSIDRYVGDSILVYGSENTVAHSLIAQALREIKRRSFRTLGVYILADGKTARGLSFGPGPLSAGLVALRNSDSAQVG